MHTSNISYVASFKFKAVADNYLVNIKFPKPNSRAGIEPIPLFLSSLGGCFAVYLERFLEDRGLAFKGFNIKVESELTNKKPAYIKVINAEIKISGLKIDKKVREELLRFVSNCPLDLTLRKKPAINIRLI